jgi:hypothetical protein
MAESIPPEQKGHLPRWVMQFIALGLLAFLVLIFLFAREGHALNVAGEEAKAYADQSIHAIITNWSEEELINRASPELQANTTKGELDSVFTDLRKLGKLQSYSGLNDDGKITLKWNNGHFSYLASYQATATFQNSRLVISIHLVKHDKQWQISGFHADPEPFL